MNETPRSRLEYFHRFSPIKPPFAANAILRLVNDGRFGKSLLFEHPSIETSARLLGALKLEALGQTDLCAAHQNADVHRAVRLKKKAGQSNVGRPTENSNTGSIHLSRSSAPGLTYSHLWQILNSSPLRPLVWIVAEFPIQRRLFVEARDAERTTLFDQRTGGSPIAFLGAVR